MSRFILQMAEELALLALVVVLWALKKALGK
jgi:hypothetical protein